MPKIWIVSDLHFNHLNIIAYSNRPYLDIIEMNRALINNWNSVVSLEDTVYFLGDFRFGKPCFETDRALFVQLNGHIKMILGNHDRHFKINLGDGNVKIDTPEKAINYWKMVGFEEVFNNPIVLDNFYILSHHPMDGVNHSQTFVNIHGHTHDVNMTNGNYFNASVENISYTPIDFEKIKEKFTNEN